MNLREIIFYSLGWIVCMSVQILLLRNVVLFDYAFCFLYIGAVLVLPPDMDKTIYLLTAFATGILLDVFLNTLGLHASATVLVAYLRSFWLQYQGKDMSEEIVGLTLYRLGFLKFLSIMFPMVLTHHAALFLIEVNSLNLIGQTLLKILASSIFTMAALLIWQSFLRR